MKKLLSVIFLIGIIQVSIVSSIHGAQLETGEYNRDGYPCKAVVAQGEDSIILQVFTASNEKARACKLSAESMFLNSLNKCRDHGKNYVFSPVVEFRDIYSDNGTYLKVINSKAYIVSNSIENIMSNKGNLYIIY